MLKFIEETHQYFVDGVEHNSVSSVLDRIKQPFETEVKLRTNAKTKDKVGIDQEVAVFKLRTEWEKKKNDACALGTRVHWEIEQFYKSGCVLGSAIKRIKHLDGLGKGPPKTFKLVTPHFIKFVNYYQTGFSRFQMVVPEYRMYSKQHFVAGTIDGLMEYQGKPVIVDWKTNAKFTMPHDWAYSWYRPQSPFGGMKECSFFTYSMQLSLYAVMLEEWGIVPSHMYVVHILEDSVSLIKVQDFRSEMRLFLDAQSDLCKK